MSEPLIIFLSSTCYDLFQERRDIAFALTNLGHKVIVSDQPLNMPVDPFLHPVESCLKAIRDYAEVVVVIIKRF